MIFVEHCGNEQEPGEGMDGREEHEIIEKTPREENLLWGWVVDEFDTLLDIPLQTLLARFQELLLVRADFAEDVFRFLGSRGLGRC